MFKYWKITFEKNLKLLILIKLQVVDLFYSIILIYEVLILFFFSQYIMTIYHYLSIATFSFSSYLAFVLFSQLQLQSYDFIILQLFL